MTRKNDISNAARALGRIGGSSKSRAKAAAARKNGVLGGRPKAGIPKEILPDKPQRYSQARTREARVKGGVEGVCL